MEKGLLEKTGKPLDHWVEVLKKSGLEKHGKMVSYLKKEHGFTHGYANFVSLKARNADAGSIDDKDLLAMQYKGKEDLKPIYDDLQKFLTSLGDDVTVTPKKSAVSFIRGKQFALVKPATKTRIDLGLKLKDVEPQGVLGPSGPFGTMCTHRIQLKSREDITDEVKGWIRESYARNN